MNKYIIRINYEEMDCDIIEYTVPDDVTVGALNSCITKWKTLLKALQNKIGYDSADACIESECLYSDEGTPEMYKEMYHKYVEKISEDPFSSFGCHIGTVNEFMLEEHPDWSCKHVDLYLYNFDDE